MPPEAGEVLTQDVLDSAEFKAAIDEATAAAVAAVQKTNVDLKTEKSAAIQQRDVLKTQLDAFGGGDILEQLGGADGISKLVEFKTRLEKDDLGKLLAEGKHDEWYEKRTSALRQDHENQVTALSDKLSESGKQVDAALNRVRKMALRSEVVTACKESGVEASAMEDVQLRAERDFEYDADSDALVIRDENGGTVFGKDGSSPKTVGEWLEEQKEGSRHWFPPSKGGSAGGAGGPAAPGGAEDISKMPMDQYRATREKQKAKMGSNF